MILGVTNFIFSYQRNNLKIFVCVKNLISRKNIKFNLGASSWSKKYVNHRLGNGISFYPWKKKQTTIISYHLQPWLRNQNRKIIQNYRSQSRIYELPQNNNVVVCLQFYLWLNITLYISDSYYDNKSQDRNRFILTRFLFYYCRKTILLLSFFFGIQ